MQIISADERVAQRRGVKALIVGPSGVGKTSLLRTVDSARTLFIDLEAGDLAVQGVPVPTVRPQTWPECRDLACLLTGANKSFPPTASYSTAHYESAKANGGGAPLKLDGFEIIFVDSITTAARLCFRHCEQQPEALSERTGRKDIRGVYGLHAREMIGWLNHLQHARDRHVIFVGILEKVIDDFNQTDWVIQLEGARTGRELPGIVDEIITMQWVTFSEGAPAKRAFVCTSPNQWGWPAKDRSGRLQQIEQPHLGKLITKLTSSKAEEAKQKEKVDANGLQRRPGAEGRPAINS